MFSNVYLVNLSLISGDDLYSAVTWFYLPVRTTNLSKDLLFYFGPRLDAGVCFLCVCGVHTQWFASGPTFDTEKR